MYEGKKFVLVIHEVTNLGGDEVLFSEQIHKLLILNSSASVVWNELCIQEKKHGTICISDIVTALKEKFIFDLSSEEIKKDIEETIRKFKDEGFLILL